MNKPQHDRDVYEEWSDFQLVEDASTGASADLNRRFMEATRRSTKWVIALTAVLVVLTAAILWLTWVLVQTPDVL